MAGPIFIQVTEVKEEDVIISRGGERLKHQWGAYHLLGEDLNPALSSTAFQISLQEGRTDFQMHKPRKYYHSAKDLDSSF